MQERPLLAETTPAIVIQARAAIGHQQHARKPERAQRHGQAPEGEVHQDKEQPGEQHPKEQQDVPHP
jgi:hypothetical protein